MNTIGATSWVKDGIASIRVYSRETNGSILERCVDGGADWYNGSLTGRFQVESGIGATSWIRDNKIFIRIYATGIDGYIKEFCYDEGPGWYEGSLSAQHFPSIGGPAATARINANGHLSIRVYTHNGPNQVEYCFDEGREWYQGAYTA